jgi:hypothetical protein
MADDKPASPVTIANDNRNLPSKLEGAASITAMYRHLMRQLTVMVDDDQEKLAVVAMMAAAAALVETKDEDKAADFLEARFLPMAKDLVPAAAADMKSMIAAAANRPRRNRFLPPKKD